MNSLPSQVACPTPADLNEFAQEKSGVALAAQVRDHLSECDRCRSLVQILRDQQQGGNPNQVTPLPNISQRDYSTINLTGTTDFREPLEPAPSTVPIAPPSQRYRIGTEIAHGGMGVVHRATDVLFKREVAIKLLRAHLQDRAQAVAAFCYEAEITARLQHPGIPPVHDLGTFADQPFLAMKLVQGKTLQELLKARETTQADISRWLQVFEQIAQAVGYAHSQGIIHRDLKPLNVMVGEFGEVQVMDWGLAKVLGRPEQPDSPDDVEDAVAVPPQFVSRRGEVKGTLAYMPPEQARGEIDELDPRSDVFGLGAILCQILTGQPPYTSQTRSELHRDAIRADLDAVFTRLHASGADADLIDLAQRCLSPDKADRPANALAVATEVAAYRAGVEQRLRRAETQAAESLVREAEGRKRRNIWLALATVFFVGVIVSTLLAYRANEARHAEQLAKEQAELRLTQIEKGNQIVNSIFLDMDIREVKKGAEPLEAVLAKRLIKAAEELEGESIGNPILVAELQHSLAKSLLNLGHPEPAIRLLVQARATFQDRVGQDHPDTLAVMNNLARGYDDIREFDLAVPLYKETFNRRKTVLGPNHPETLHSMVNLGVGYEHAGQFDLAIPLHEDSLRLVQATLGPRHADTLTAMNNLAAAYKSAGNLDLALPLHEKTLRLRTESLGSDHPDTLGSMSNLASSYQAAKRLDLALPLLEETFLLMKQKLGSDHPSTFTAMSNLAGIYRAVGKDDLALPLLEQCSPWIEKKFGLDHLHTILHKSSLADVHRLAGNFERSQTLFEESLPRMEEKLGADHASTLITMCNLALTYKAAGKLDSARELCKEMLERSRLKLGPDHPTTLTTMNQLADVYRAVGELDLAMPLYQESLEVSRKKLGDNHSVTILTIGNLGAAYSQAGEGKKAALHLKEFVEAKRRQLTKPTDFARMVPLVAAALLKCDEYAVAEEMLREALTIREQAEPDLWTTFHTQSVLGEALLGQKKYVEAESLLLKGYAGMKEREKSIPVQGATRIPEAIDRLIKLYTATENPAEVKKFQAEREKYPAPAAAPVK